MMPRGVRSRVKAAVSTRTSSFWLPSIQSVENTEKLGDHQLLITEYVKDENYDSYFDHVSRLMRNNVQIPLSSINQLIQGLCNQSKLQKALKTLQLIKQQGLQPDRYTYTPLIHACAKKSEISHVKTLAKEIQLIHLDIFAFNTILKCFVHLHHYNTAKSSLCRLYTQKKLKLDSISYKYFIQGELQRQDICSALKWLKDAKQQQVEILPECYSMIMFETAKDKNVAMGMKLFNEMKSHNVSMDNSFISSLLTCLRDNLTKSSLVFVYARNHLQELDSVVYSCFILSCIRGNRLDKAVEIYFDLCQNSPAKIDSAMRRSLLMAALKASRLDYIHQVLQKTSEDIQIVELQFVYSQLFRVRLLKRDTGAFLELVQYMKSLGLELSVPQTVTNLDGTNESLLRGLIQLLPIEKISLTGFNNLIEVCLRANNEIVAKEIVTEMRDKEIRTNVETYRLFMSYYLRNKKYNQVRKIFNKMKHDGYEPNATCYKMAILVQNNVEKLRAILHEIQSKSDFQWNKNLYLALMDKFNSLGYPEDAKVLQNTYGHVFTRM